jgi:hypothetical protein
MVTAVQLRLGFPAAEGPLELSLSLAGLTVLVEEASQRYDAAYQRLVSAGIHAAWHDVGGLSFAVRELPLLAGAAGTAVTCDDDLRSLWELVAHPGDAPATLDLRGDRLHVSWDDHAGIRHTERVPAAAVPALLALGVSFLADSAAWRRIEAHATVPVVAGWCQENHDGFVEIRTSTPQLVEASPLPGLFRIDETHFGMPSELADAIDRSRGFVWDSPASRPRPSVPSPYRSRFAAVAATVAETAGRLDARRAAVVVSSSGLNRRIVALETAEALDAWPLLVVCSPAALWSWQRSVELVGRTSSLVDDDGDVRLVTYHDLARLALADPPMVVLDEPIAPEARLAWEHVGRFDALADAYRLAVCSTWPDGDAHRVLKLLRPVEFSNQPVEYRYPHRPAERLAEHTGAYRLDAPDEPMGMPRVSVAVVDVSSSQLSAIELLLAEREHDQLEADEALVRIVEVLELGTDTAPSPKLALAVERARAAHRDGRRLAVVVSSPRAAQRLERLLRPLPVSTTANPVPTASVAVLAAGATVPNLLGFSEVVVCSYPASAKALDLAVGPPMGPGPKKVTVVHADHYVDDRLAVSAALARELGQLSAALTHDVLLTPRF